VKLRLFVSAAFIVLAALVAFDALAEDTPPANATDKNISAVPPAPQKFYLEVDQADLETLSKALSEMPFKLANPLLLKLNGQLQVQQQLKEAADKAISDPVEKAKKRK
jgi:hypothetical protein